MWFGATPVIVVSDAELGRAVNLRNPNRHTSISPVMIMSQKDRIFDNEGILLTKKWVLHFTFLAFGLSVCSFVLLLANTSFYPAWNS